MRSIVVLISGRGSNLQAMCRAGLSESICSVISSKAYADGLSIASSYGIPTHIIDHTKFATRELFDLALAQCIDTYSPKFIALAGFMRILTPWFVNRYAKQMINIHPSLLPAFIGPKAQNDAVNAQVKLSGATVHFVTQQLDHGPIIAQGVVAVKASDTEAELSERILALEHVLYPFVLKKLIANEVTLNANAQVIVNQSEDDTALLGIYNQHIYY